MFAWIYWPYFFPLTSGNNISTSPPSVSSSKNQPWFCLASQIWVRSEAEVAIIGSTIAWASQFGFRDSQVSRLEVNHAWGMPSFHANVPKSLNARSISKRLMRWIWWTHFYQLKVSHLALGVCVCVLGEQIFSRHGSLGYSMHVLFDCSGMFVFVSI